MAVAVIVTCCPAVAFAGEIRIAVLLADAVIVEAANAATARARALFIWGEIMGPSPAF